MSPSYFVWRKWKRLICASRWRFVAVAVMHWHVYFWHNIMYFLFQVTYFMNSTNFGSQKNQPALWSLTFIRNDLWKKCEIRSRTEMLFYDWTITVTTQIVFHRFRYDAYRSRLFQYRQHNKWHRIDCGKRAWAFTLSPITLVPSTSSPATWRHSRRHRFTAIYTAHVGATLDATELSIQWENAFFAVLLHVYGILSSNRSKYTRCGCFSSR